MRRIADLNRRRQDVRLEQAPIGRDTSRKEITPLALHAGQHRTLRHGAGALEEDEPGGGCQHHTGADPNIEER